MKFNTLFYWCFLIPLVLFCNEARSQIQIQKCDNKTLTIEQLVVDHFLKGGIKITKIESRTHPDGIGIFTDPQKLLGIKEGIVLATGNIDSIKGPNKRFGMSSHFPDSKDYKDDDFITHSQNFDAMVLIINFIPTFDSICFEYCFGSEEYPEFVNSEFNDLFVMYFKPKGLKVNGSTNIALLLDQQPVCINQVNKKKNSDYFIDNTFDNHFNKYKKKLEPLNQKLFDNYEYDGFTKLLTAGSRVLPGKEYELKIIICDLNDFNFDSGVFLKSKSFRSIPAKNTFKKSKFKKYSFQFDVAKATLTDDNMNAIPDLASYIISNQIDSIYIIGHTDSTGNADSNFNLSIQRASTVKLLLINNGVSEDRIRTLGKGSKTPINSNATYEGRMLNRRVEILLFKK